MPGKKNKKGTRTLTPKLADNVNEMTGEFNRRMGNIGSAVNTVTSNVSRGAEAAGTLRDSIRSILGGALQPQGAIEEPENTVHATVDSSDLPWLDLVVEAGIVGNREEAASFFITEGVTAHLDQLKLIEQKVKRLRQEQEFESPRA